MKTSAGSTFSMFSIALCLGCGGAAESRLPNQTVAVSNAPAIEFDRTEFDLGDVPVDREQKADASIEFRNAGGAPLHVAKIETSCQCAVAHVDPLVAPQAEGHVRLKLARSTPKPHTATVVVHSNDPKAKHVRLTVKWRAVAPVEFEPYSVDFGSLLPDRTAEKTVRVVVRASDDAAAHCEIGSVECYPPAALEASWESNVVRTLSLHESLALRISLRPGAESGDWHGKIVLPLPGSRQSQLTLPVRWTVRDRVEVSPASVFLGSGAADAFLSKSLTVSVAKGDVLEIDEIRIAPGDSGFSASIEKATASVALIRVQTRLSRDSGPSKGSLAVTCKQPVVRTINVPLTAFSLGTD
ncbi:MAG TPA: DUF1573 domain-containing protein [Pirellulales bacterium]|nr:DUF1573 domain-containing protein [Pirellulales bacterium]